MEFPKPKLKGKKGAGDLQRLLREEETPLDGRKCRGILVGGSVIIENESDISTLLRLGFYGKGVFSRSFPIHASTSRVFRVSSDECWSSGGRRKRVRRNISQSEASEGDGEQRKRRKLLLHAEWTEERQRLLSLQTETDSACIAEKQVEISGAIEHRESPSELEGGDENSQTSQEASTREGEVGTEAAETESVSEPPTGEGELGGKTSQSHTEVTAEDLYPVKEPLFLMPEEAFYLAAELKILQVSPSNDPSTPNLPPDKLWRRLCEKIRFPFTYAVYWHYRKKGWVPKTGLKFGVDFILYKDGPDSYHSSYAVLVTEGFEEGRGASVIDSAGCGGKMEKPRWMDIIAHCRVCESTAKELVVVCVTVPGDCTEACLRASPEAVERLRLNETLVTRWVPDKDR